MRQQFAHRQSKSDNQLAFTMWLVGCTDKALAEANYLSLSRSYGIKPADAQHEINAERRKRAARG